MNDLEKHFKQHTDHIRMTDAEKNAMRFRVEREMGVGDAAPQMQRVRSPYMWLFAPRSLAMLSVALLVVFSTGTTYAAEGSLPGATLYPVKTKIIEPLKVALAPSVEAKAQANATIAATRVQEAQTLAAQGTLTPEVVQEISHSYNKHAQAALALAASVEPETDEEMGTSSVSGTAGLDDAHADVLVAIDVPATATTLSVQGDDVVGGSSGTGAGVSGSDAPVSDTEDVPDDSGAAHTLTFSISLAADSTSGGASSTPPVLKSIAPHATSSIPVQAQLKTQAVLSTASSSNTRSFNTQTRSSVSGSATSTPKTPSLTHTLRESLSVQAKILRDLDAQVRSGKGGKGDE